MTIKQTIRLLKVEVKHLEEDQKYFLSKGVLPEELEKVYHFDERKEEKLQQARWLEELLELRKRLGDDLK